VGNASLTSFAGNLTSAIALLSVAAVTAAQGASAAPGDAAADPFQTYGYYNYNLPYALPEGPHLFIDWRYVSAGRVAWQMPDGSVAEVFGKDIDLSQVRPENSTIPLGLRLEAQTAKKHGPIIEADKPWESIFSCSTLLYENGKYRLWYEVKPPEDTGNSLRAYYTYFICYAESDDGLNWTKPALGIVTFDGSEQNNIVFGGDLTPGGINGSAVFVDPIAPPEERYKMMFTSLIDDAALGAFLEESPDRASEEGIASRQTVMGAVSPDGLHWELIEKPLVLHKSDTQTVAYYDAVLEKYVGYFRVFIMGRRAIARAETDDFRAWPVPETVLWPEAFEEPSNDYYMNSKSLYPGTTTMHLMFPAVYSRRHDAESLRMASSLTGKIWQWVPGGYVLEPGPVGSWDGGLVPGGCPLVEIGDSQVALPYTGYERPHKFPRQGGVGAIGLALWEKERLSALVADERGYFRTIQLKPNGRTLFLNFSTAPVGHVRVGVVGSATHSLQQCEALRGNELKYRVTWDGSEEVALDEDGALQLEFEMYSAELFSFEFR